MLTFRWRSKSINPLSLLYCGEEVPWSNRTKTGNGDLLLIYWIVQSGRQTTSRVDGGRCTWSGRNICMLAVATSDVCVAFSREGGLSDSESVDCSQVTCFVCHCHELRERTYTDIVCIIATIYAGHWASLQCVNALPITIFCVPICMHGMRWDERWQFQLKRSAKRL